VVDVQTIYTREAWGEILVVVVVVVVVVMKMWGWFVKM
jgi:hypothetical protein